MKRKSPFYIINTLVHFINPLHCGSLPVFATPRHSPALPSKQLWLLALGCPESDDALLTPAWL